MICTRGRWRMFMKWRWHRCQVCYSSAVVQIKSKGTEMNNTTIITETQNKDVTRTYNIVGPKPETVASFWKWLAANRIIERFDMEVR